jgi:hypothetical protein
MLAIAQQYNRNNNNKRPHVTSDSSSSYSAESEMSISSSRLAPSPSPDLFYIETDQLPPPMPLNRSTLQFRTTETIPTVLFKDKHLEDGEVLSQSEPLIPGLPLTSKASAQVHIKVEHFEAVTNARETEAKTDATTSTSTTTATNTDSDKENKTPYTPSSISPELDLTDSQVGRSLAILHRALCTHYLPRVQTSFERCTDPSWTDNEEEEIEDDSSDDWGKPNPADQFKEICSEHSGEGWHCNDPFTIHHYPFEIFNPVNYDRINAPYLTFHIHCDHIDVSATYGRGYPIITHTLEPIPVDYHCPPLTPEQIEILDPKIGFAGALKRIIDDHLPIHLSAAVQRYQYYKSVQYKS